MATLRLSADLSELCVIREFVSQTSRDLGLDECVVQDLQLAADEICSNVVLHGYDGHRGEIEITVERCKAGVQVIVRDRAKAFDPESVPAPDIDAPLQQRPVGGLGLFLVRQLMDEVRFEFESEQGNSVTMIRRVPRERKEERT